MKQNDIISVIVPVYNMEKYLDKCVESITNQTYPNLEIILVDDGSKDNSPNMCDDWALKDNRVKVVHKENGGLSDARNAGLQVATGSYIGYVDSDDWIEPDMYECMYKACTDNNAQMAVCKYYEVSNGKKEGSGTGEIVPLTREELLNIYISGHDSYVIYHSVWSKLFKRELVDGVLFPVGHNSEDIMYSTKAFCSLNKAVYIDKSLYNYVVDRTDSIMNQNRIERMFRDELPFWREHIEYVSTHVSEEMGTKSAHQFYRRLLFYYIDLYKYKETRKAAAGIIEELRKSKSDIVRVYRESYVPKGDRVRMKTVLFCPKLYYVLVKYYDKVVIPIRLKL